MRFFKPCVSGAGVPSGCIVMWSGLLANIPSGWGLCDGTGGKPDLRSKFIMGAPAGHEANEAGGSATHSHSAHAALTHVGSAVTDHAAKNTSTVMPTIPIYQNAIPLGTGAHLHEVSAYVHSVTQPSQHAAQSHSTVSNNPVYYTLAFIIKI